ncbi:hypothetical protein AZE42_10762 [Rhizopogon vesiculosus]|uniref:Uncharacterized protein n=1 Tax=Rhizopogon vesiculosus TaxID=180088 RepID=A0A1J8Q6G9_9AGAM|nr:hypothetical protein AZE42_10762 [Rhizopogon vesiculosus]
MQLPWIMRPTARFRILSPTSLKSARFSALHIVSEPSSDMIGYA